ncbi:MAG: L,D-transpeptidase family protein [Bacteroidota bacterium]|nr:L,D-transpeptidase family protein [Bacteroidota bacterium]
MRFQVNLLNIFVAVMLICCWTGCKNHHKVIQKEIVKTPEEMDDEVADNIKASLLFAKDNSGKINDLIRLSQYGLVNSFYQQNNFKNVWSHKEKWTPQADSMFAFIGNCKYYGLYPADYHFQVLNDLRNGIINDTLALKDAITWTKADLTLSDAFMKILKDLKEGRLIADSVSISEKRNYIDSFFVKNLNDVNGINVSAFFDGVEPVNTNYQALKNLLKNFVDSMDTKTYLYINYPYKDSLTFFANIHKRLGQSGFGDSSIKMPDSVMMSKEIKKYQAKHHLLADGKIGPKFIKTMNANDNEKFKRIAINLDRYKQLPALPETYIWVNLPGFYLKVIDSDTVVLESKVIVGKPDTRTPTLISAITDMVTYPQWTMPESIIKKDILPELKKNPGYLAIKGFSLLDSKGNEVNPYTIKWSKYTKGIPWKVVQGSGDDNALGIFKFNFNNPYSVYLHDTNQRYLFKNAERDLSHGCVRVQNWEALAYYIARNDSMAVEDGRPLSYNTDSIKSWIAIKSRKRIMVKKRLPLFIEYFTCDIRKNKIIFYDDIYNEDRALTQKYFAGK